jgi:integrase/recombinase XerD
MTATFAASLQTYFTTYLSGQKAASIHTISAYRDTWRMLLIHLQHKTGIRPADLTLTDLDADSITDFLQHLQNDRHNSVRTRNARLAAIHSFYQFASYRHPEQADLIARVLAIQTKKTHTTILTYLSENEVTALLEAPDRSTRTGRRDHAIMLTLITTGLRIGELTALRHHDLQLNKPAHLRVHGKGRKDRITPLNPSTADTLRRWTTENPTHHDDHPVFAAQGSPRAISADAIAARLRIHAHTAALTCASLAGKNITPHTLRHTCAMRMLDAGIDITTIAIWLGHESTESTQTYLHADLGMKQRALDRLTPPTTTIPTTRRYKPNDQTLNFLEASNYAEQSTATKHSNNASHPNIGITRSST